MEGKSVGTATDRRATLMRVCVVVCLLTISWGWGKKWKKERARGATLNLQGGPGIKPLVL